LRRAGLQVRRIARFRLDGSSIGDAVGSRRQYTHRVTRDSRADDVAVSEAVRRQSEDPENHDLSLIEECLRLTPEQRLQRLKTWVSFVASARPAQGSPSGGRH
jgi:hypothetical protein